MQTAAENDVPSEAFLVQGFLDYASAKGLVPASVLERIAGYFAIARDNRFGQVAVLKGLLRPSEIPAILQRQIASRSSFGELTVEAGLLSQPQVDDVLNAQSDPQVLALAILCANRPLSFEEMNVVLSECRGPTTRLLEAPSLPPVSGVRTIRASDLTADKVRATLRQITSVAALPEVVQRALALLEDAEVDLDKVATVIQVEAAIAARVVRLSNTAFFGARRRVTTIREAILTLGTAAVRQVLLMASVMDRFKSTSQLIRQFWERSILIAQWSASLARARPDAAISAEVAFTAGIFVDLGEIVIRQHFPKGAVEIARRLKVGASQSLLEREVIGLTHEDISSYLCTLWNFPAALGEAVLYHHASTDLLHAVRPAPLTAVVNAAGVLAELPKGADGGRIEALDQKFLDYHKFDRRELLALLPKVHQEASELHALLG